MTHMRSILSILGLICMSAPLGAQEVDTVRVGSSSLEGAGAGAGARLQPGAVVMGSFERVEGVDTPTSTTTQHVALGRRGADDVYVIETVHVSPDGDTTHSSIVVRAADYSLMHHRVKAAHDSAAVTATATYLTGWVALPDQPVSLLDRQLDHPVFPVEGQIPWLFPLLPLAPGYAAAIPHYSEWAGAEQWKTIRVTGTETVRHGGEAVDCWVVDGGELFPGYRVTYWVAKSTHRIIQGVARGAGTGPEYWSKARP